MEVICPLLRDFVVTMMEDTLKLDRPVLAFTKHYQEDQGEMTESKGSAPPTDATAVPVDARPTPARRGRLGLCVACNDPVAVHFNTLGEFIGCPAAELDTVFVLWPYSGAAVSPGSVGRHLAGPVEATPAAVPPAPRKPKAPRRGNYFRHVPTPKAASADPATMTENRRRGWEALLAVHRKTKRGAYMPELEAKSGLPSNILSEAMRWLENKGLNTPIPERRPPSKK